MKYLLIFTLYLTVVNLNDYYLININKIDKVDKIEYIVHLIDKRLIDE